MSDIAIGSVHLDRLRGEDEVSYEFVPRSWGEGRATEAVAALLTWVWANYADGSVIAVTQTANRRSCRLVERLGFNFEREFEEWGATQSQYRLTRPENASVSCAG